ncbi:methyltransferase [Candidatus Woesearchaeota archaeon]|nr:methyltransferase [Candidatus Woesearchaeota archaeon]
MADETRKTIRALAVTDRGVENVLVSEIEEIVGAKALALDSCASFESSIDDVLKFTYLTQASDRVMVLLGGFKFEGLDDLLEKTKESLKGANLSEWFPKGYPDCSFKVTCERRGLHDFGSQGVEPEIGGLIIEAVKRDSGFEPRVDLKDSDVTVFLFINNDLAHVGIDLAGRDLSKRTYRIFSGPGTVNAKIAFAMSRIAGYKKKLKMIDLYARTGIIPIEAALHESGFSVNFHAKDFSFKKLPSLKERDWDSFFRKIDSKRSDEKLDITGFDPLLRNVEASNKNAKLAGIDKLIRFSKMDLEWMDVKLDENTVDLVVSRIPCPSSHQAEATVRKAYKELFHQAEYFLKSGGKLCVLGENLSLLQEMITKDFKLKDEERLWAGQMEYELVILCRVEKVE